jgi:hypothetical protein
MLRGSKELSDQDWMGRGFTLCARSADEVLALLLKREVDWVLVENTPATESTGTALHLLTQALNKPQSGWSSQVSLPVQRTPESGGHLQLYQRTQIGVNAQPARPLHSPAS